MINSKKRLGACATIGALLILSPLTTFAQTAPANSSAADTATTSQTTTTDNRDQHHDYGWIGLLGLLGLTGLMRKRDNSHRTDYAERTDDRRSTVGPRS